MCRCQLAGFCLLILLQLGMQAQTSLHSGGTQSEMLDTVYIAPDTIKSVRVDTVFEYIDEKTPLKLQKKQPAIAIMCGPQIGVDISRMYPLYSKTSILGIAGFNGMFVYNTLFLNVGVSVVTNQTANIHYSKHYTDFHHWTDTVKTVLDEYIEIIGSDTIRTQVIKKTYIPKTDTVLSDSTFSHKNSYWNIQIPIEFGYSYKTKKTWFGFGIGPCIRLIMANSSNRVISGDTSFVQEKNYLQKLVVDIAGMVFIKRNIKRNMWTTAYLSGIVPLQSNYHDYNKNVFNQSLSLSLGLEYYLSL